MKLSRSFTVFANACLALGSLTLTSAAQARALSAAPSEVGTADTVSTKPYTLYSGRNFLIQWKGKLRPIIEVKGSSFVVDVDGKPESILSTRTDMTIKIEDAIKVTPIKANVANYKYERVYTAANDPQRRMIEAQMMAELASETSDAALGEMTYYETQAGIAGSNVNPMVPEQIENAAIRAGQASAARADYERTLPGLSGRINSVPDAATAAAIESGRELFDAFSLTFDVSSPHPLRKPYVVVITRFHDDPKRPDTARQWVYAQNVPRVDANPYTVRVRRSGFPPGYTLDSVEVHLFDGGTEVATNIARKRVALTSDEAFQFSVVEYIEQHRDATLPALQATHPSSATIRSRLTSDQLSRTVYMKIGKNGIPTNCYWNATCTEKISDPELAAFLNSLRFDPALNSGKPVEAVATVHLDSL